VSQSVTKSECISAAPSGRFFVKFDVGYIEKFVEALHIRLTSDKNIGHFAWRLKYVVRSIGV